MTPEQAAALRAPFPPEAIGHLPKAGTTLAYVGHAATCDRLLQVDPDWTWEPPTSDELQRLPNGDGMWIKLTVCGVTRFGWGDGKNVKEWISDAIRNAAMRFGVALDLWSKEDLRAQDAETGRADGRVTDRAGGAAATASAPPATNAGGGVGGSAPPPTDTSPVPGSGNPPNSSDSAQPDPGTFANKRAQLKSRCVQLQADHVSVADARAEWQLPIIDECDERQLGLFDEMLAYLEKRLEAPFAEVAK